jgi:hypothetical protein
VATQPKRNNAVGRNIARARALLAKYETDRASPTGYLIPNREEEEIWDKLINKLK